MKKLINTIAIIATMLLSCNAFAGGSSYKIHNCFGNDINVNDDSNTAIHHNKVVVVDNLTSALIHIEEAAKWLGYARDAHGDNTYNIKTCREKLAKVPGATLRTIGTSESELHELMIAGYLAEAKKWWGYAEERLDDNSNNIKYCLEYLEKAGATLESIGGSEDKIYHLLRDGYEAEAERWWNCYVKSDDRKIAGRFFMDAAIKASMMQDLIDAREKTKDKLGI